MSFASDRRKKYFAQKTVSAYLEKHAIDAPRIKIPSKIVIHYYL